MKEPGAAAKKPRRQTLWNGAIAAALTIVATAWFGAGVRSEPAFPDEAAYIAQSYFLDNLIHGDRDSAQWLEYQAYDLPPLPKYLIGAALKLAGMKSPGRGWSLMWYANMDIPFVPVTMLWTARWPSVIVGGLGCGAIFALGAFAAGRATGTLAALLLMANPLYRLHARRAMADVIVEACVLATLAVGIWWWQRTLSGQWKARRSLAAAILIGVLGGLAVLSKLNGGLAWIVLGIWTCLGFFLPRIGWINKLALAVGLTLAGIVGFMTFLALNPYLTARPAAALPKKGIYLPIDPDATLAQRLKTLVRHRVELPRSQQTLFPRYALRTAKDKLLTVAIQGFGRFGPFGPPKHDSKVAYPRFDLRRDIAAPIWLLVVAAGAVTCALLGKRQANAGEPPTYWAILAYAIVTLAVVVAYIPLAWDRYLLPIQSGNALLGAVAVCGMHRVVWRVAKGSARVAERGR